MSTLKAIVIVSILTLSSNICLSQPTQDTVNILFVGNSYTFVSNIPHLISMISDSTDTKIIASKSTIGGAKLSDHWRSDRGLKTRELIRNGGFDIVVLQEHSLGTIQYPDSFFHYSQQLCGSIKESGASPYFYCTWAREKVPQFQETVSDAYRKAALDNDAGLVLVGEAWARAKQLRPEVELYLSDGSHQSPLGAFLSAMMFVEEFTGEIPEEIQGGYNVEDANGESVWMMYLDWMDIAFCQKIVEELSE